jgi:GT2 family glycosyltransferase
MVLRLIGIVAITVLWTSRKVRRRIAGTRPPDPVLPSGGRQGASDPPAISIVVLSCNRLVYLRNTLQALLETDDPARLEIIVVDNGSHDGSVEYLQRAHRGGVLSKLLLLRENLGISAGYNHGFALADARSPYLMKLDSDIMIQSKDWLARVDDFLRSRPQVGFAALHQVNHPILLTLPVLRLDGWRVMDFGGWPCGSAMILPRRVRAELGCFVEEPKMTYVPDDIDYYARIRRKGYQGLFLHDVVAYHQMNLDRTAYRSYNRDKALRQSGLLAQRLARDYDRGTRPLENRYEQYQHTAPRA